MPKLVNTKKEYKFKEKGGWQMDLKVEDKDVTLYVWDNRTSHSSLESFNRMSTKNLTELILQFQEVLDFIKCPKQEEK